MAKQTFENAIKRLENIVAELESGKLTLERAVRKFEEGIKLSSFCARLLDETERKVNLLLKTSDGDLQEVPFEKTEE